MAHPQIVSRPLGRRVYWAVLSQAFPYVVYGAITGAGFGAFLGMLASMASFDTFASPLVLLYAAAGLLIGSAIAIRPVFRELLAFHWSADVLGR